MLNLKGREEKSLAKILAKRQKVIRKYTEVAPNYFKWEKIIDLEKYSTYIVITPRSIGKTYSAFETAINGYELTSLYTVWMRTTAEEIKNIVQDYKSNPPYPIDMGVYVWQGNNLIEKSSGKIVIKFVALSTVHNFASITGNGAWLLIYDEFLPRTNRRLPRAYFKLADFIKTLERDSMMTVLLQANATTLNSDILMHWDIWNDVDEKADLERRMYYRYFKSWENPPKVESISTSSMWATNDKSLGNYMDKAEFLDDGDGGMILPESRLGNLRYYYQYRLNGQSFTLALTDDNQWVIVPGERITKAIVYALTTADGLQKGRYMRPLNLKQELQHIYQGLENSNLIFTSYELKDNVMKFLDSVYGKLQRSRE